MGIGVLGDVDVAGIGLVAVLGFVGFCALIIAMVWLKRQNGGKSGAAEIIDSAEQAAANMLGSIHGTSAKGLSHGQKIGKVIDATDSLGVLLVSGGYLTTAEWQPMADKITAAVAQTKHPTAPEVTAA